MKKNRREASGDRDPRQWPETANDGHADNDAWPHPPRVEKFMERCQAKKEEGGAWHEATPTSEPSTTGTSGLPNFSRRYSALRVAILVRTFPNSEVTPTTSSSGDRNASSSAQESSTPGSVSIITFLRCPIFTSV